MLKVFANRWASFHTPVMTTVFNLHPDFCRRDTDKGTDTDFDKVLTDLAKAPGAPSTTVMKIQITSIGDEYRWSSCRRRLYMSPRLPPRILEPQRKTLTVGR